MSQDIFSSALIADNITKIYPSRRWFGLAANKKSRPAALSGISFAVKEGETVGLLGPNGAGKTTLLKIIATMLYPSSGKILLYSQDLFKHPSKTRGMMGLVTCDERSFYWRLTGRHNLSFFASLYGIPKKRAAVRVQLLLEVLGLSEAADRPFYTYSSGMKQKLAIARGLLSDPNIVLYDEPTRALDPLSALNIRKWIVANRADTPRAIHIIATNQLNEAEQLCDRVLIINKGVLIAGGTIQQIREAWHDREYALYRITYRGPSINGNLLPMVGDGLIDYSEERSDEQGCITLLLQAIESSEALSHALHLILGMGGTVVRCETEQVPFDEVFCSLVMRDQTTVSTFDSKGNQ